MTIPAVIFTDLPGILAGYWENENTKDTWHFKPQKHKGYTAMEIIQSNSGTIMLYAYKTIIENKIFYVDIDNIYFELIEINRQPPITIKLKKPAGNIITLHKR